MATNESYKEFLDIIDLGLSLGNFIGEALEDGSFDFSDIYKAGPVIDKITPAIENGEKALDVIKGGLTPEQYADLEEHIYENFDIPQENIEAAIEWSVSFIFGLIKVVKLFKKD